MDYFLLLSYDKGSFPGLLSLFVVWEDLTVKLLAAFHVANNIADIQSLPEAPQVISHLNKNQYS